MSDLLKSFLISPYFDLHNPGGISRRGTWEAWAPTLFLGQTESHARSLIIGLPVSCPIINELSWLKKDIMVDESPSWHCMSYPPMGPIISRGHVISWLKKSKEDWQTWNKNYIIACSYFYHNHIKKQPGPDFWIQYHAMIAKRSKF